MSEKYIPALRFRMLTRLYDPVVRWTTREDTVKRALIAAARTPENATVVDVGCGTGTLAIRLKQQHPSARVIGLDADLVVLRRAEDKAQRAGAAIEFVEGNAVDLPFPGESADRVVSSLFFHHLRHENKRRAFSEIVRILKPGGEVHIADWGMPANWLMKAVFYPVRFLDGFATTDDNVHGRLVEMIELAGACGATQTTTFATMLGTLSLLEAQKPPGQ